MRIHLTVTLDTECDRFPDWEVRQPLSFLNILEGVPDRLQPLFERYAVKPTYLLSPEIIQDDACVELFKSLVDRAELAAHLHAEFIEPQADRAARRTPAFQCDYSPEIEQAKLRNLTDLFAERFGYRPTAFRAGRYGIGPHTLEFLAQLGYLVDSSVTPWMWWRRNNGFGVNFLGAPGQPYRPAAEDCRRPGAMGLWEVPITIVNPRLNRWPLGFWRMINPLNRWHMRFLQTVWRGKLRPVWLRPTFSTAEEMLSVADLLVRETDDASDVVLCMMLHTMEATASMSPYNLSPGDVDRFLARMADFFEALTAKYDVRPVGLSDVPRIMTAEQDPVAVR